MTNEFVSNVRCVDKKLKGAIPDALGRIVKAPLTATGDTLKPLGGDKKGLWRFRLGDYRLVYKPEAERRIITLIAFAPREDVYDP
jgi:mRNA-degrading endonuclease RelE of RelBE toxin-antitoxin system